MIVDSGYVCKKCGKIYHKNKQDIPIYCKKCGEDLVEEYADVFLCIHALFESEEYGLEKFTNEAAFFVYCKQERWLKRLQEYGVQKKDCP